MNNRPKAIILGGSHAHIALIENLKRRGYYTVLVDYYEEPPAKRFADEHIRESTLDQTKILDIAQGLDAKLVISTCLDQPIPIACYVSERLGLPTPYKYETTLNVTNKGLMKKKMVENQIPTSKYIIVDDVTDVEIDGMKFPVIVKPIDSTGSLGVRKANDLFELNKYLKDAIRISRTNKAIVEEYSKGIEVSFDCFIQNKIVHLIMMRRQFKMRDDGELGMQSIGSITPIEISQTAKQNIQQVANKIADAFDLDNTPLLIQAFINDDNINIIEFAARLGGGTHIKNVKLNTGFDILNSAVDSYLGIHTNIRYKQSESYCATNIIYSLPGVFGSIMGCENLIDRGIVEEFFIYKTKGMEIPKGLSSRNRVGAFLVKANTKEELFKKIAMARNEIEVLDADGNSIMRKDIYLRE
ncbi:ATP-grasp domain-containing protein [Tissierella sp. MSJ-40]|uniref:ATP-grasp domain-containing protein n=1 Tax=Tissierella simiarum TaxID=2841534 RepID=A0ABS6E179_9FIRM|nr:ATP-grasp domain-containing protein [Tissierella simiarum]MBU5436655.1 ATP-grasp domain-containing protein [Tissierella simiarum]